MRTQRDKLVIEHWITLYNRLTGSSYGVTNWLDSDSSRENVDALCADTDGRSLALEHTLIEPFANEKADAARFLRTLALLDNDPALCVKGYVCIASQSVGAIPTGIRWLDVQLTLKNDLAAVLPTLPEGSSKVLVRLGNDVVLEVILSKRKMPDDPGRFLTARLDPGQPGPELIRNALNRKLPKLAAAEADKRILLLEKDSVVGMIEDQYAVVRNETDITTLRRGIE